MKFNIIKIILLVLFTAFQVKAHNKLDNGRVNTRVPSPAPYSLRLLNTSNSGALSSTTFTNTIPPLNTITLSSAVGTNSQSVCNATAITNITYTTTGATGATFSGLPTGVTGAWLSNVVTISGTPTASGTFSYIITLTGGFGTVTALGTITSNQLPTVIISGASVGCGTVSLTASGGISYVWSGGNSINTASNTFSSSNTYTVTATDANGCLATASQSVTVNSLPAIASNGGVPIKVTFATAANAQSIVFDTAGNLFVASSLNATAVRKITSDGTVSIFATGGSEAGITIDASGNLYVTERAGRRIRKITPAGIASIFVSTGLTGPSAITSDASGNLYVIDGSFIRMVDANGYVNTFTNSGLSQPKGLVCDASGNIYVSSAGTISKITPDGNVSTYSTAITSPLGLAFDSAGVLYVSTATGSIQKVTADGAATTLVSGIGSTPSLAFDSAGDLYTITGGVVYKLTFRATVCNGGSATLIATPPSGATIDWYASATGGNPLLSDSNNYVTGALSSNTTFYVESRNTATGCVTATRKPITVTVNPLPTVETSVSPSATVCSETAVTLTGTGATSYTWSGGVTNGVAFTPASTATYTVTGTDANGCTNTATQTVTVTTNNTVTLSSAAGTNSQTICINSAINTITYATTGATGATFSGLPTGVNGTWLNDVVTISGTPTVADNYTYTVTVTGGCGTISTSGTISVNSNPGLSNFNAVNKTFFDIAYTITPPTSTSLGAFTYTSSDINVATINGSTVAIVGPGTTSITATQAANGNYCNGSIASTLTVKTVTVLTKHGEMSTSNLNYVNKNGAIATDKSVTIHGEVVSTK